MIKNSLALLLIALAAYSCIPESSGQNLIQSLNGGHGQIEIGGKYVSFKFHHSRPLPSLCGDELERFKL
jgi:hypothetical protein